VSRHVAANLGEIGCAGTSFVDQLPVEHHGRPVGKFEQLGPLRRLRDPVELL
jgi:hypothetical protein